MNRNDEICALRREMNNQIDKCDFQQAAIISAQIERIKLQLAFPILTSFEENHNESAFQQDSQCNTDHYQRQLEIQDRFHTKFAELQDIQTIQRRELATTHVRDLEACIARPVPQCQAVIDQAKALARMSDFENARKLYHEAIAVRDSVIEQRKTEINASYEQKKKTLSAKHDRELSILADRRETAITQLRADIEKSNELLQLKINVSEKSPPHHCSHPPVSPPSPTPEYTKYVGTASPSPTISKDTSPLKRRFK